MRTRDTLAALALSGLTACAHGGQGVSVSYCPRPVETLPVCGFEAPYLPEPCKMQVAPGEWLEVRNPKVGETKHHGWLWWVLAGVIL